MIFEDAEAGDFFCQIVCIAVGVLLSSFGVFWTGEGLGITWPGSEGAFVGFVVVFLLASLLSIRTTQRAMPEVVT